MLCIDCYSLIIYYCAKFYLFYLYNLELIRENNYFIKIIKIKGDIQDHILYLKNLFI